MPDDPISGYGGRIVQRARVPVTSLLALPLIGVAIEYFFFLVESGATWIAAVEQVKTNFALFVFLGSLPPVALAFARELQLHELLDKIVFGTRAAVGQRIACLMAQLAVSSGYEHPEKIRASSQTAMEWFYHYANEQKVLRSYAFELWESYYVGLYLWSASAIALIVCGLLAFFTRSHVLGAFAVLSAFIFFAGWGVRRWSTIPRILHLPAQQIAEISPSGEVLNEAKRRFG